MKTSFLFLVCIIIGASIILLYPHLRTDKITVSLPIVPTSTPIPTFGIAKAPSQAVLATITSLSGDVMWQSRVATQPAAIISPITVQQGEALSTGDSGKVEVQLKDTFLSLLPNTHLEFTQTLPQNFVLNQSAGTVTYTNTGDIPLSVRSLHLLVQMEKGVEQIIVDPDTHIVTLDVQKGSAKGAFNDTSLVTTLQIVAEGNELIYDDDKREVKLKKIP